MHDTTPSPVRRAIRLLLLMAFLPLLGCETMVAYQFEVANAGTRQIDIAFQTPQLDTSLSIAAGGRTLLFERSQLNSGVKPYFEGSDTIWWFSKLAITADSLPVKKEVRLVSFWTFSEKDKKTGLYLLTLGDQDF